MAGLSLQSYIYMVEINQEENPIIEVKYLHLRCCVCTIGKTLLQFGLSSKVNQFFCLIDATNLSFLSKSKKNMSKHCYGANFSNLLKIKNTASRSYSTFLWDMNLKKCCNGFDIQFRQTFAKETFSYDEYLKN